MTSQSIGLLVGGLLPAILYGLSGIFSKASTKAGIGLGLYLIVIGLSVTFIGAGFYFYSPDRTFSLRSGLHAFGFGATWGLGTGLVAIGLTKYAVPLGKLVPLYNMNTLVAVLLALWIFAEWKDVRVMQLLAGSLFIIAGGILVARA